MNKMKNGPFKTLGKTILASGSPRRRELLGDIGLKFEVHPSTMEEPAPEDGESSEAYALRMAKMKTLDVAKSYPGTTVIGADTIVVLNDRIMGKPQDDEDALSMLTALSGNTHQVVTAYCIVHSSGEIIAKTVSTDVDMRISNESELRGYIATGEPKDKAGAYAIQGIGTFLVTTIRGSYTNVVGLPVARVLEELLSLKAIAPSAN